MLVDMSCGSGLFSRRFAKSGRFAGIVAADFSENMLKQTAQFFREDPTIDPRQAPHHACIKPVGFIERLFLDTQAIFHNSTLHPAHAQQMPCGYKTRFKLQHNVAKPPTNTVLKCKASLRWENSISGAFCGCFNACIKLQPFRKKYEAKQWLDADWILLGHDIIG